MNPCPSRTEPHWSVYFPVKNNSGVTPAGQCGAWVKEAEGGYFTSPNYPEKYPPEKECVYIIEGEAVILFFPAASLRSTPPLVPPQLLSASLPPPASPRQCIDLFFDDKYSIEPSWDCKFDHIEVRNGPFGFSPLIGRYCGQESPAYVRSSGRYLYIKFVADGELEAIGFSARYNFTQGEWFSEHGRKAVWIYIHIQKMDEIAMWKESTTWLCCSRQLSILVNNNSNNSNNSYRFLHLNHWKKSEIWQLRSLEWN